MQDVAINVMALMVAECRLRAAHLARKVHTASQTLAHVRIVTFLTTGLKDVRTHQNQTKQSNQIIFHHLLKESSQLQIIQFPTCWLWWDSSPSFMLFSNAPSEVVNINI